ncbi:MAG: GWxTD domain-containing protein [Bacteroidota bacterium]
MSQLDTPAAGRTVVYTPGVPNFDLEAVATWRDGEPGLDFYIGIPHASLIFLRAGDQFQAGYEAVLEIRDGEGKEVLGADDWSDDVVVSSYETTQSFEPIIVRRRMALDPGEYVIRAALQDENGEKQAVRAVRVAVPSRQPEDVSMSGIRLEAKKGEMFEPQVAFHMPANLDSLRTIVELYNTPRDRDVELSMTLIEFRTDTLIASAPYWVSPNVGSLAYRGVDYSRPDTLQSTRRQFTNLSDEVTVIFTLPPLRPGNYLIDIRAQLIDEPLASAGDVPAGPTIFLQRERELSIKAPEFPRLTTLRQGVEALTYIAYDRELKEMLSAETPEEMRRLFDEFWGGLISNKKVAANIIKQYYGRIEEANQLFTTHKEGWKTDRGMVYILLGAPAYVETLMDAEVWHYSYSDRDPLNTFYFQRARPYGANAIFNNYILARRAYYERAWLRAVERWRSGAVL